MASGPTLGKQPRHSRKFQELIESLRDLQFSGQMYFGAIHRDTEETLSVVDDNEAFEDIRRLLQLNKKSDIHPIVQGNCGVRRKTRSSIEVATRSLLGVMHYLSYAVEIPEEHEKLVMRNGEMIGKEASAWKQDIRKLFSVKFEAVDEDNATSRRISVEHRGLRFYIEDTDLESKITFSLLLHLLSLHSGKAVSSQYILSL